MRHEPLLQSISAPSLPIISPGAGNGRVDDSLFAPHLSGLAWAVSRLPWCATRPLIYAIADSAIRSLSHFE